MSHELLESIAAIGGRAYIISGTRHHTSGRVVTKLHSLEFDLTSAKQQVAALNSSKQIKYFYTIVTLPVGEDLVQQLRYLLSDNDSLREEVADLRSRLSPEDPEKDVTEYEPQDPNNDTEEHH